jgi:hypothetical protein
VNAAAHASRAASPVAMACSARVGAARRVLNMPKRRATAVQKRGTRAFAQDEICEREKFFTFNSAALLFR